MDVFFSTYKDQTARPGVINDHAIHSAAESPRQTFSGKELYPSVHEKAAVTIRSLIKDHAFVDANKRTGMVSGWLLLAINGIVLHPEENQMYQAALNVATDVYDIPRLTKWLRRHSEEFDFSEYKLLGIVERRTKETTQKG